MPKVKITNKNNIPKLQNVLKELNLYAVEIGIFGEDDKSGEPSYVMIARVHEFGMTIKPKNAEQLTVPVSPKAKGKRASDFPGIFRPKGTSVLAIPDGNNGFEVLFVLKDSITVPERSFIRSTFDEKQDEWEKFIKTMLSKVLSMKLTVQSMFKLIGERVVSDIQEKITDLQDPPNAPSTIAQKGSSNPLIDTGGLRMRVTYRVVKR